MLGGGTVKKLTLKQKAFADYYIELGNATEAYIRAGYSATKRYVAEANARRLLANYSVKNYINERIKQIEDARIADAKEVLQYLTSVLRGEIKEEVIVVEGTGEGCSDARIIEKQVSAKERNKAAELLGKRYALFNEKLNIDGVVPVVIVDDLKDEEDEEDDEDEEDEVIT